MILAPTLLVVSILAAPQPAADRLQDFSAKDVRQRTVESRALRGKVVLLGLATDKTSPAVVDWQVKLGYQAATRLGGYGRVAVVSIADVSEFSSWIARPFAKRTLARTDRDALERLHALFAADGADVPPDLDGEVFLVPDWTGEIARSLVPAAERDRPHLFVVDVEGTVRAHFTENGEAERAEAARVVAALLAAGGDRP